MKKQTNGLLNCIAPESRERILAAGQLEKRKKGDIIFWEQDEVDYIYFVMDGFVSLYRNSHYGELKIMFICTEGEMLNEVVLEKAKTSVAAKALSDITLLKIPSTEFELLLRQDFNLVNAVFNSLSRKTRRLYHQVGNANGTYPLEKHLAAKIWKLARDHGKDVPEGRQVRFDITVTLLSHIMGAKRESVSRIVSQMKKNGYIIHEKSTLIVPDMDRLRTLV